MAFVEDDEPEPVAQAIHVQISRVVGRHGERLDVVVPAAEQPDLGAEAERELVVPLVHQVDGGSDDQGGPAGPFDRQVGQVGLAGSGRQDDHAAAAFVPPGLQTLDLVGKRLLGNLNPPGSRLIRTGRIRVSVILLVFPQMLHDGAIPDRLGAELLGAEVELHTR